uniref:Odorant receptor n=1 Tax=Streltzoviella insularis TaxID=1206366 RepID=A0A7D5YY96_9NEOP|nr:odorant receptor 47 [Streltzoviella insularis]
MIENLQIDFFLKKQKFLFRYNALNLDNNNITRKEIFKRKCLYIINFLWLNTDFIGEVLWLIDGVKNGKSFTELTYIASCIVSCLLANTKAIFHELNEHYISNIIEDLRKLENKGTDPNGSNANKLENKQKQRIIEEETNFLNIVLTAEMFLHIVPLVGFVLRPLIQIGLTYYNTNEIHFVLPFLVVFPFDTYDIKYWPFIYVHQIWSGTLVMLNIGAVDSFFFICCAFIKIQFRLLKHDIEKIIPTSEISKSKLRFKLRDLIKWHQELIRLVNLVDIVNSKTILVNFILSTFLICLCGFNATINDETAVVMTFTSFLLTCLLQIYLLCFFGDMIVRSSSEIADAAYICRWYSTNPTFARKLLIIQTRAKIPCKLTAFGYADVDLQAFTKILSTSWSYFALLNTVYTSSRSN